MNRKQTLVNLLEYYQKPTNGADIYIAGLSDIADHILAAAISELVKTSTFMPRVNEIRVAAHNVMAKQAEADRMTGDQLVAKLNQLYDEALAGNFDADNFMRHVLLLRNSDREYLAQSWRDKYNWLKAGMPNNGHELAADWETPRHAEVVQ